MRLPQAPNISKISRNFKFTSDVSVHAIASCQGVFVPVPAFADYFSKYIIGLYIRGLKLRVQS